VSELNHTQIVREYIDGINISKPIFLANVKNLVGENAKMILTRLTRDGLIVRFEKGIYYKPAKTIWGNSVIGIDNIIKHKYIEDEDGNIKGYITGARLFNHLGFTTQVPRMTEVVSNESNGKNRIVTEYSVIVRRPKIKVDNDNYLYQQLIDIVENKTNVYIETEYPAAIIKTFYKDNHLDFAALHKIGLMRGISRHTLYELSRFILEV